MGNKMGKLLTVFIEFEGRNVKALFPMQDQKEKQVSVLLEINRFQCSRVRNISCL